MTKLCPPISNISVDGLNVPSTKEDMTYLTIKTKEFILILTETVARVNIRFFSATPNLKSKVYCRDIALG